MKKNKEDIPDMAYNTQQEFLIMPEYGRNVQQLVRHAQKIEDYQYRQQFCEEIVNLIQQLYPQSKTVEDYREKLWQHLFHIAKYDLDAATPSGSIPRPEDARKKPQSVPYPEQSTRFKHYGNNVHKMINRAVEMEEGVIKDGFINTIGSYMKLAYKTWNREHFVSDEIIKNDLDLLSNGALSLEENSRIDGLSNASRIRGREDRSNDRTRTGSRDNNDRPRTGSRDNNSDRPRTGSRDNNPSTNSRTRTGGNTGNAGNSGTNRTPNNNNMNNNRKKK